MQMLSESTEHWNWTLYLSLDSDACIYITIHRHHCACNANVSSCWAWRWGWGVTEHGGCAAVGCWYFEVGVSVAGVTSGWEVASESHSRFSCGPLHLDSATFDLKQVCLVPGFSLSHTTAYLSVLSHLILSVDGNGNVFIVNMLVLAFSLKHHCWHLLRQMMHLRNTKSNFDFKQIMLAANKSHWCHQMFKHIANTVPLKAKTSRQQVACKAYCFTTCCCCSAAVGGGIPLICLSPVMMSVT